MKPAYRRQGSSVNKLILLDSSPAPALLNNARQVWRTQNDTRVNKTYFPPLPSLQIDNDFKVLEIKIETLNGYYIETRYPLDIPVHYSLDEAKVAVDIAFEIRDFIAKKL